MRNQKEISASLKINAIVDQAIKDLNDFGSALNNAWKGSEPPKQMQKSYKNLETYLGSLTALSKKLTEESRKATGTELKQAASDYAAIQKIIHSLTVEFGLMSTEQKRAMLSTEEQANMKARAAAIKEYTAALTKNNEVRAKRKPLEDDRAKLVEEQQPRRTKAQATLDISKPVLEALEKQENLLSKQGEIYKNNLEWARKYQNELNKLESKPNKTDKDNKAIAKKREEIASIDLTTGKEDYDNFERYNNEVKALKTSIDEAQKEIDEMDSSLRKIDGQLSNFHLTDETAALQTLKDKLKELGVEGIEDAKDLATLEQAIKKLDEQAFARLEESLQGATKNLDRFGDAMRPVGEEIDGATESIERQNQALREQEAFESKIKQFIGLQGAAIVMRRALQDAMQTIKELDTTMTEMAVVTNLGVGDYWEQLPEYTARANDLGMAINDVYKADTLFYQQGLKTNEVVELSTQTIKMARVAGLDTAEATDRMTAALRGFNMELNEVNATNIADVYSKLAAITASDVDEISSAMTKTASIAASAGMEFETTAAFLSQIIETTRESAETAGTAMKTVIARFQELKKDPAEIGEVDGEIVDANKIETALRSVGVALRDNSGQFRELDDVFLELSSKWDSLDKNTQRYIATIAAGSRQQSRFIAMMSDYARTQELVVAANNSAGASQEQFEKTMESLDAKLNELKNAWNEFTMSIMNSDLVKLGVDMLTKFLQVVNKATSGLDGIAGSLTKIISVVAVFKLASRLFKKVETPLFNLYNKIVKESYGYGFKATQEYKRGAEDAAAGKEAEVKKDDKTEQKKERKTFSELTGWKDLKEGGMWGPSYRSEEAQKAKKFLKEQKKAGFDLEAKKQARDKAKSIGWEDDGIKEKVAPKGTPNKKKKDNRAADARAEYEKLNKEIQEYENAQAQVTKESEVAWDKVGQGISSAGIAIAGLGIGLSAVGGILSELGLEEAGEGFAKVGNVVTLLGTGISFLGGIVPTVANLMAAAGIKVQAAWWPLLVIGLAIAAIVGIIAGIVTAIEKANAAKLENRMKAAAEATKEAKEAAQEAKDAYQGLLDTWDRYKDTQNSMEDLVVGTTEWKEALHEANLEVLDLISEYPELQKWVHRTSEGQLKIAEEGWKELEEKRLDMMNNTNMAVMEHSILDLELQIEETESKISGGGIQKIEKEYKSNLTETEKQKYNKDTMWTDEGDYYQKISWDAAYTKSVQQEFKDFFVKEGRSLEEGWAAAELVANSYATDAETLKIMVTEIYDSLQVTEHLREQQAEIAETYLSQIASNTVKNSDQYDNIVSFYGNYVASEENQQKIEQKASSAGKKGHKDLADNDFYGQLLKDYEVSDAGNNMANMQALYKKMTGKSDEDIADLTYEQLAKAVAEIGVNNELADNMTDLAQTLAGITDKTARDQVGALLGDSGAGLTKEMVNDLFEDGLQGSINEQAVRGYFEKAGLSLEEVAKTMGVSVEALIDQIEANTKKSYNIQVNAMKRLNAARQKHLGEEYKEQEKFSNLSISQSSAIANKLTDILATSGTDLSDEFEATVLALGDKADIFTSYISSINWSDTNIKEKIQAELEAMDIEWNDTIEKFVNAAFEAGHAISVINFETLNQSLKDTYDLLQVLRSGGQSREFEEAQYKQLIEADGSLAKDFVQIGDKFVYVGTSIDNLINALDRNTYSVIEQSKYQYQQQSKMASVLSTGDAIKVGGVSYDVKSTSSDVLERDKQVVYLQGIRNQLLEEVKKGNLAEDALSFVTGADGKSLGLSFTTDFTTLSDEMLAAAVDGFQNLASQAGNYLTKYADAQRESRILGYTQKSAEENATKAEELGYKTTGGKEYVEALIAQATLSGGVAEAVIEKYKQAIESGDGAEIKKYEAQIIKGINNMAKNQEQIKQLVELQNQVEEMLYNQRQEEIDKLSAINDSINEANSQLLSKVQEQIDDARQARDNEKTEQNIADLEAQRAYLAASGGSAVELAALDKQIAESKESYQDSLVDQALANIQDANEKAAEQRQEQIDIAQQQLDHARENGELSQEAEKIMKESLDAINAGIDPINTSIGSLFAKESEWHKLTDEQLAVEKSSFGALITNAANIANALGTDGYKLNEDGEGEKVEPPKTGKDVAGDFQKEIGAIDAKNESIRTNAVNQAKEAALSITGGWDTIKASTGYQNALSSYTNAGGLASEFESAVQKVLKDSGEKLMVQGPKGTYSHYELFGKYAGQHKGYAYNGDVWYSYRNENIGSDIKNKLQSKFANAEDQQIVLYGTTPYINTKEGWREIIMNAQTLKSKLQPFAYKTGGLADFTGPAWLDGTKARPELVLNQTDTQNFIALKDILSDVMKNNVGSSKDGLTGNNYFDIEINVESLENDYDVEQIADKIRNMIYQDATRRNVNAVNQKA